MATYAINHQRAERYRDSIVYYFSIEIDGDPVREAEEVRFFSIQVADNVTESLESIFSSYLLKFKQARENTNPIPTPPSITL